MDEVGFLHELTYPPYCIEAGPEGNITICGGGGGNYKSGIPNLLEIYDLTMVHALDKTSHPLINNIVSFNTNNKVISSMDKHFNYLLTAEKEDLCEYIQIKTEHSEKIKENDLENKDVEPIQFELKLHRKVSNCLRNLQKDAEITIVKYCGNNGSYVLAGGNSGMVKIYQRYNDEKPMELVLLKEFHDVSDGKNIAIACIDVSPNGEEFVSICDNPDGKYARVWNIARGVKVTELALTNPKTKKLSLKCAYKFKHCCYANTYFKNNRRSSFILYMTHQPAKRDLKAASFMSVWGPNDPGSGNDYQLIDVVPLGNNKTPFCSPTIKLFPTALAVSNNGLFSAIGSAEGQVNIYKFNTKSSTLALVYSLPKAHSFVVTDLSFLPSNRVFKTFNEFEVVSVGLDNMLRYHRQPSVNQYLKFETMNSLLYVVVVIFICDRLLLLLNLM